MQLLGLTTHHICSLIFFPCNSTVLILKSIPKINKNINKPLVFDHEKQFHVQTHKQLFFCSTRGKQGRWSASAYKTQPAFKEPLIISPLTPPGNTFMTNQLAKAFIFSHLKLRRKSNFCLFFFFFENFLKEEMSEHRYRFKDPNQNSKLSFFLYFFFAY